MGFLHPRIIDKGHELIAMALLARLHKIIDDGHKLTAKLINLVGERPKFVHFTNFS